MMTYEVQLAYDEYCIDCAWEGVAPMSFAKWYSTYYAE